MFVWIEKGGPVAHNSTTYFGRSVANAFPVRERGPPGSRAEITRLGM